ncbi:hypothetical protein [Candidatus Agathobaculum pullicola]|uniref:hypothetical protein n=1 Tax=Candidatus Agathobaculum pullicola TaxID=2838426 RepID=UPI003F9325D7
MKRLKANKTTLYNLVRDMTRNLDWLYIPALRKVTFEKAYRRPNFSLSWRNDDGTHSQAFFCACLGCATLAIELHDMDEQQLHRVVCNPSIDNLIERGMVEDIS